MAVAFLAGVALGAFLGLRAGAWWALGRLSAFERRERMSRVRAGRRRG